MALAKCKECGNQLAKSAKACPHCGALPRRTSGCTWMVLIVFVFWLFHYITTTLSSPATIPTVAPNAQPSVNSPGRPPRGVRAAGHLAAKRLVPPALTSPSTASFPWDSVTYSTMTSIADGSGETAARWLVRGEVEAQNALGVPVRSHWEVVVIELGNDFAAAEAKLGDKVIFQLKSYRNMLEQ